MYTALVLTPESRNTLLQNYQDAIPAGWEVVAHHMTINMGSSEAGPAHDLIGQEAEAIAVKLGQSDLAIALEVATQIPSTNNLKHITLAVNRIGGGKPKDSNKITNWEPAAPITLKGIVQVVK